MIVGEDSAGEESSAVRVRLVPGLPYLGGAVEAVEFLCRAAQPG